MAVLHRFYCTIFEHLEVAVIDFMISRKRNMVAIDMPDHCHHNIDGILQNCFQNDLAHSSPSNYVLCCAASFSRCSKVKQIIQEFWI